MAKIFTCVVDAENQSLTLQHVEETTGAIDTGKSEIRIKLAPIINKSVEIGSVLVVEFREWDVCVPDGNGGFLQRKAMFLSTDVYEPAE